MSLSITALALLCASQSSTGPAAASSDGAPSTFLLDYSDAALEIGTFARDGDSLINPVLKFRVAPIEFVAIEVVVPFATADLANDEGTSVIGNLSLAGLGRVGLEGIGMFEGGFGVALPTGLVDRGPDGITQLLGTAMLSALPPFRFGHDTLSLFMPLRFESEDYNRAYVQVDGLASIMIVTGDEPIYFVESGDLAGTLGVLVRGGYRPGMVDLSVGFGASVIFGDRFFVDELGTFEGQIFVEPGIGFRIGPQDEPTGFRIDSRLRIPIDGPFGGGGLDDANGGFIGIGGIYSFTVELGYRFDLIGLIEGS